MTEEVIKFYKEVSGITVSEELANDILSSNMD